MGMNQLLKPLLMIMILGSFGFASVSMATEEAEYRVLVADKPYELRYYQGHVLAETLVEAEFKKAGNKAFRRLFRYISGDNQAAQKVSMTAPVGQVQSGQTIDMTAPVGQSKVQGQWAISFMLPAKFSAQTAPQPTHPEVYIRAVPPRYMAAIRYSGFWSEARYREHLRLLEGWIADRGYQAIGEAVWARYNPPMLPWFLRRNEILVPVDAPDHGPRHEAP